MAALEPRTAAPAVGTRRLFKRTSPVYAEVRTGCGDQRLCLRHHGFASIAHSSPTFLIGHKVVSIENCRATLTLTNTAAEAGPGGK